MNTSHSSRTTTFDPSPDAELNTVTVSLALAAHSQAQRFRQQHSQPAKAKQVYLNTLAVYAVKTYLERTGFEVDLAAGQSWDVAQQTLLDVADLSVHGHGVVECRPVLPQQTVMQVPPEVWSAPPTDAQALQEVQRQGYVAVLLDASLKSATLLGFMEQVDQSEVALTDLSPLDDLMPHLLKSSVSVPQGAASQVEIEPSIQDDGGPTRLKQWLIDLQDTVETGWRQVEQWLVLPDASEAQLAWGFRSDSPSTEASDGQPVMIRSKSVTLGSSSNPVDVALTVGIVGYSERTSQDTEIWVQVTPTLPTSVLPPHLVLMVLDNTGEAVMQAQSRSTEAMQLRFGVDPGELFSLQLTLDDVSMTESFVL